MDILSDKEVITRKDHSCWGCCRKFPKGSRLRYTVAVDGGNMMSSYWCNDCCDLMSSKPSWIFEDGIAEGDLIANYPEHYNKELP